MLSSFYCRCSIKVFFYWREICPLFYALAEFINLISSESNEVCSREEKRTIAPEHVLKALQVLTHPTYLLFIFLWYIFSYQFSVRDASPPSCFSFPVLLCVHIVFSTCRHYLSLDSCTWLCNLFFTSLSFGTSLCYLSYILAGYVCFESQIVLVLYAFRFIEVLITVLSPHFQTGLYYL